MKILRSKWARAGLAFLVANEIRGILVALIAGPVALSEAWRVGLDVGARLMGG